MIVPVCIDLISMVQLVPLCHFENTSTYMLPGSEDAAFMSL
jgi:hypothetical protein